MGFTELKIEKILWCGGDSFIPTVFGGDAYV